ncbi:bleomycin hydrolase [Lindgomyces ingoldianus]|uniref:Bleomycin hydrolase n=1 Tax=Lindgomyces ingoldianus TaxID=673940 RepID=A0ACB6QHF5_9PLEO|nr:bleomycin hydrolase [Lindgomyces ingoldianus]KAF2465575.1 bleomycin hydrolase [Lindgomyces ingoldianus]
MGSSQSKVSDVAIQEKLVERLQALQMKNDSRVVDKDYVYVDGDAPPTYTPIVSHKQDVSATTIEEWEKELMEDPKNRLALAALSSNPANAVLSSRSAAIADTQNFNIKIPLEGSPITNQASSGRCWLFASTNVFRVAIMKKHRLSSFQLSQSYLFYWDKIEKANYFLENILDTASEDIDSRIVQALLASPVGDGGQWDMVANLVQKYGLVPQTLYPDSYNALNSSVMDRLITTKLREDAIRLRSLASSASTTDPSVLKSSIAAAKEKMLREIHLILTLMLGPPPAPDKAFTWEFYDRDENLCTIRTSPTAFAKELSDSRTIRALSGTDIHSLFSLVNDPRNAYNRLLSVKRLGNVYEGRPVTYVNVDMTTMKKACISMLQRGFPVFFGSDVGKYSDSAKGIMDTNLFEYELGFNVKLGMKKAERLMTGESQMTHAMVLTAVHVVDGKSVRWRVENSWSDKVGDKGYFVMSDAWMDEFVYQAVVDPSVVSSTIRKVLEQKPKMLELWDPMGALA